MEIWGGARIRRRRALVCDGQFDQGGGGECGRRHGGLVDHGAVGPLRGGDVVYFAAQLGDVEAVLRVGSFKPIKCGINVAFSREPCETRTSTRGEDAPAPGLGV